MKTQTKTEIRNNTAKATKLLRGIDNEATAIAKAQSALDKRVTNVQKSVAQVTSILGGISNTALAAPVSAPKTAPAKKAAKPAKPAKKAAPKKAAPKKAVAKAVKAKAAPKKAVVKAVKAKPAVKVKPAVKAGERPPLKSLINAVLDKVGAAPAADIYKQVCAEAGYFSRQSLYNALKDDKSYSKTGEGASATFKRATGSAAKSSSKATEKASEKTSDEEVDSFVEKSTTNPATATAT